MLFRTLQTFVFKLLNNLNKSFVLDKSVDLMGHNLDYVRFDAK